MTSQEMLFQEAFEAADAAGKAAAAKTKPVAMVVQEANFDGSKLEGGQEWYVADGVCGFAWVSFPGNTAFGKWAKKTGKASPGYPTGLQVWVHNFNQSYDLKMAYAVAFARTLNERGFTAYPGGRLD